MNQIYVNVLVSLIRKGIINSKTGESFKTSDILNEEYRTAVETELVSQ